MPPQTAISPPVGTYALIFYSHWGNAFLVGPDPSAGPAHECNLFIHFHNLLIKNTKCSSVAM